MPGEHLVLCGEATTKGPKRALRLQIGDRHNIQLGLDKIAATMAAHVPNRLVDLLEIATYIYVADQAISRGSDNIMSLAQKWRRQIRFRIPVRDLDFWSSPTITDLLAGTLGFLTDDDFVFEFTAARKPMGMQGYLIAPDDPTLQHFDEVILFSGGLDSLGGLLEETLESGRRVAAVSHNAATKLAANRTRLLEQLHDRVDGRDVPFPITVYKDKQLNREYTQRSRSFLYASLAATIASMLDIRRIRFYENGVLGIHLPVSRQLVGSRASRSTHPQALAGFARLFGKILEHRFLVENPFLWKTKAEVVAGIRDSGHAELIKHSNSCMHTWTMTKKHPHCGTCSQCIDRRFAILAAGVEEHDPETGYKVELLLGARDGTDSQMFVASYAETAKQITKMNEAQFFARFGEAARAFRHVGEQPGIAARKIFNLYQRHATSVTQVITASIAANADAIFDRTLPAGSLLSMVCPSKNHATPTSLPMLSLPMNMFRREGQAWRVRYNGGPSSVVLPSRGSAYLHLLLSSQGKSVPASKLAATVSGEPEAYFLGDAGQALDEKAIADYRVRLADLVSEIDIATRNNDEANLSRLEREKRDLLGEIKRAGVHGKPRLESDARNKVRNAVSNALKRGIKKIGTYDPHLATHLLSNITCGNKPSYSPEDLVTWAL